MPITHREISKLEKDINEKLTQYNAQFIMTFHFSEERLNDARNQPPITVDELEKIFTSLIDKHITAIVALNHEDSFNIRCTKSHINMPCGVLKESQANGSTSHKSIVITVMRKEGFKAKDPIEFKV